MKFEVPVNRKKCFLFRAKDYCSLMKPCFFICCILGVFPYKVTSSTLKFSKLGYVYSTFVTSIYVIHVFIYLYQTDVSGTLQYDNVPGTLQANFYYILGTAVAIIAYCNTHSRLLFLEKLYIVASKLPSKTFNELSKFIHAKDIFGFLFLIGQMPNVMSNSLNQTFGKLSGMYATLIVFIMDMLYMNCTCVIKDCFIRINENLKNLQLILVTGEPHLLRRVYHEKNNPLLLMELKAIKKRHQQVSDILQQMNTIFGSQIIITSLMTFAEVTFSLYFYILRTVDKKEVSLEKQIWYAYFITSVAYYSIKLSLIAWACETAKNQAAEVGSRIHEVVINTTDKDIKNELQLFSLQVLHRDNTFTSKGLTMDANLLTTIVGSITTYLLILIQFLISLNPCKSHNNTNEAF
ncbi:PREDICTED: putative gustatory receptor 23a, isoform B [Polistes canadensis]|uniref:putative gustatory receptor 23a, isoform B n=1 Tax=Polistes canadensis TaxID=91411 RepID=UPI000718FE44|nr:PREDICTED: putative gustatory receptor 23a, isoform B [Polistes canadensis]